MATCFSIALEKALVNLVNRRMLIRMVRLLRSTYDVLAFRMSGLPSMRRFSMLVQTAGEYRVSLSSPGCFPYSLTTVA